MCTNGLSYVTFAEHVPLIHASIVYSVNTSCRIATAFLDRLRHISSKMRAMLGEVRAEAKEMIKAHHRHGGLFTVEPSYNAASPELTQAVSAFSGHKLSQPMTAPMMALSLLSNTAYLIDHGVMNLTLPRLSLMYPHDAHAQEMCLNQVKQVCLRGRMLCHVSVAHHERAMFLGAGCRNSERSER